MVSLNIIIFCQKNIVSLSASVLQGYEQLKYSSAWIWTSISATFQWPACLCFITVTPGTLMTKGFKCHCLPAYPNFCMFSPVQLSRSCRSYIQLPRFHVIPFFVKKSQVYDFLYQLLRRKGIQAWDIFVVNQSFILIISDTVMQMCFWTLQTFFLIASYLFFVCIVRSEILGSTRGHFSILQLFL